MQRRKLVDGSGNTRKSGLDDLICNRWLLQSVSLVVITWNVTVMPYAPSACLANCSIGPGSWPGKGEMISPACFTVGKWEWMNLAWSSAPWNTSGVGAVGQIIGLLKLIGLSPRSPIRGMPCCTRYGLAPWGAG